MFLKNNRHFMLASILGVMIMAVTSQSMAEVENRFITVSGKGETSAAPDTAWITSGVNSQAKTADEALNQNNTLMQDVIDVYKKADIEDKNIQTSGFNVHPVYDYNRNSGPPELTGYQVSNTVTVKVTDLDDLGEILDAVVNAGSNQISGIRFGFDDDEALMDEARIIAVANARKKAELYAEAADVSVGDVVNISELNVHVPQPVYHRAEMAQAKMMDAGSVPVMTGEQQISASVTIVYELEN